MSPQRATAKAAESLGISVLQEFFGEQLGERLKRDGLQADLIAGNNVYAHVPDINDFTRGVEGGIKARRHNHFRISASHAFNRIQSIRYYLP
ncbi:hypothetical protein [Polynucleobacter necessarius]|uniref:hypothetical protein n=1 Tax=Polynucleobacter necessarius TaxID=576610 RepID=UPI002F9273FD